MNSEKRFKILILCLNSPFPPNDGGKICVYGFIDYLRNIHDFTCLIPVNNDSEFNDIQVLKKEWPEVTILISDNRDKTIPQHNIKQNSRFTYIKKIIKRKTRKLRIFNFQNKKLIKSKANLISEKNLLDDPNYSSPFGPINENYVSILIDYLNNNIYDIIQVELTRNINLINLLPKNSIRIYEQIESRFSVINDYLITKNVDKNYINYVVNNCEELELFYMRKYDAVLTLNDLDLNYLKNRLPDNISVFNSPFGVLDSDVGGYSDKMNPEKLVFSGSGMHYPNHDALLWYLKDIHKHVFDITGLKLFVTGNWSNEQKNYFITEFKDCVEFTGYIDDYSAYLKNSIMIVPMRIGGGGLRTKILYSMANGVPVVATTIGVHGIGAIHNKDILIADTSENFASCIINYFNNIDLYRKISKLSFGLFKDKFSQKAISEHRNNIYKKLYYQKLDEI
jgi:glycosyltransferase involved in cell wall biosynthesis